MWTETASPAKCLRILVVDADPAWHGFCHALASKGLEIVAVSSAVEALQNAVDGPFAAALIDVDLKGTIDGIALARRLKDLVPRTRIVLTSKCLSGRR